MIRPLVFKIRVPIVSKNKKLLKAFLNFALENQKEKNTERNQIDNDNHDCVSENLF